MNSHNLSELAPVSLYAASTTKRLVIRQELFNDRPAVLFVVEFDHELGSPDCDAEELLTAVTQVVKHADSLPNILCFVFTSTLLSLRSKPAAGCHPVTGAVGFLHSPQRSTPSDECCSIRDGRQIVCDQTCERFNDQ
jgi:hypothetical protein